MRIYEATRQALERAKALGGKDALNCIAEPDPTALAQARVLNEQKGSGPLYGVPVLIKDNVDVQGLHTTAGSPALADNLAAVDAPIVRNLRKNGAVILGKTNMTEFANHTTVGMPNGYSSGGGQVIHAAHPSLDPSGSSSGSGVAVAAGIVSAAVGTDTSYSIIACAQNNGICGIKPPVGTLSAEGIIPIARSLDTAGPLAWTFSDALALYSAMRDASLPALDAAPSGSLRLAVNTALRSTLADDRQAFLTRMLQQLRQQGAAVDEIEQPSTPLLQVIMQWEFRPHLEDYLRTATASRKTLRQIVACYEAHPETMMKYGITLLKRALDETPGSLQGAPYLAAKEAQRSAMQAAQQTLADYDAVILTGRSNFMHFCCLPSVTVAAAQTDAFGVRHTVTLYGLDELRLYRAALAIEALLQQP